MDKQDKIDLLNEKIESSQAIVVGIASGMSAANGERYYYQDDDDFKKLAGGLRNKYDIHSWFALYYDPRVTTEEHWAMLLRHIKHLYEAEAGETYKDLAEILKGKNYYIVTTNQDFQTFKAFPEDKITRLQGDFRYFQCKNQCHDEIYYNEDIINELYPRIESDRLPGQLIPKCPVCGGDMADWVRSREFLQGKFYKKEFERYMKYLRNNMNKKVLFLELGVGVMTPMFIKEPFMNMVYQWPNAFYVTINPKHAIIPKEIEKKSLAINDDILYVLKKLLGKGTEGIERDKGEIFDSGRVY